MGCFCDTTLGGHTPLNCPVKTGGISDIIFIDCAITVVDPTDPVEINALIGAGTAVLVGKIRAEEPEATPNELPNADGGGPLTRVSTFTRTIDYIDQSVTDGNVDFYNKLTGSTKQAIIRYPSASEQRFITSKIVWTATDVTPPDHTATRQFHIIGTYISAAMSPITAELVGVYAP